LKYRRGGANGDRVGGLGDLSFGVVKDESGLFEDRRGAGRVAGDQRGAVVKQAQQGHGHGGFTDAVAAAPDKNLRLRGYRPDA